MTTKSAGKQPPPASFDAPSPDDLRAVYEVHTLAQMLYGHLATTHPWLGAQPMGYGSEPFGRPFDPRTTHEWPVSWGYPYGWFR